MAVDLAAARAAVVGLRPDAVEQRAVDSLAAFVRATWRIVEPGTVLRWSWHMDLICGELERVFAEGGDLVICIPPGYGKSLLTSVFLPAWAWIRDPSERMIYVAGSDSLARRDSRRTRLIVLHDFYTRLVARRLLSLRAAVARGERPDLGCYARAVAAQEVVPWSLAADQQEKVNFATALGGVRQCLSFGAHVTGERGRGIVVDDPLDAKAAVLLDHGRQSEVQSEVVETFDKVLSTRLSPFRPWRVVIAQRLHEDDLPGVLLRRGWRSVVLPEQHEPGRLDAHPADPRRSPGELAFPAVFDSERVAERARSLGSRHYAAQCQQAPTPMVGGMLGVGLDRCERYLEAPEARAAMGTVILSVDATFGSKGATASYVAIQAWGAAGARKSLLWQDRGRWPFPELRRRIVEAARRWPAQRKVVIERKANGQAVLDDLAGVVPFLGAFDPAGSKEARAGVLASAMESGDVAIPHPDSQHVERVEASWQDVAPLLAEAERRGEQWPLRCRQRPDGSCLVPWVVLWEAEVRAFPAGRNDDQVDASSQAVIYLADHYVAPLDCRELNRQPATSAWQDIGVPPPSAWADGSWNGSA